MDKLSIVSKLDIKAGPTSLIPSTAIELKDLLPDGAPAPLYAIPARSKKTIEISPAGTTPANVDSKSGAWVVSFLLISSDIYPAGISYTVDPAPPASTVSPNQSSAQGGGSVVQQQAPDDGGSQPPAQAVHGDYSPAHQGSVSQSKSSAAVAAKPASQGVASPPPKTKTDRNFPLEYPHLFLGQGAVKLLSPDDQSATDYEPSSFLFTNDTDKVVSVSVYIGRAWKPKS